MSISYDVIIYYKGGIFLCNDNIPYCRVITKMFGNFWTNVVILVNFWSFNPLHVQVSNLIDLP